MANVNTNLKPLNFNYLPLNSKNIQKYLEVDKTFNIFVNIC